MSKIINNIKNILSKMHAFYEKKYLIVNTLLVVFITTLIYFLTEVSTLCWVIAAFIIVLTFIISYRLKINKLISGITFNIMFLIFFGMMVISSNSLNMSLYEIDNHRRNITSFELSTPKTWDKLDSSKYVYHKYENGIWETVNIKINNRYIPNNLYGPYIDYARNYITEIATWKKASLILIHGWKTIKVLQVNENLGVSYYIYMINIPGERDLVVEVLAPSSEIEKVSKEWEKNLENVKLHYQMNN